MLYFHGTHRQQLESMEKQCEKAKNIEDLHRFGCECSLLLSSSSYAQLFLSIARKTDISHLEAHHKQLSVILIEFENCSNRLKHLNNSKEDISNAIVDATALVKRVSTLVSEHEREQKSSY
jgi:hypothetical protein